LWVAILALLSSGRSAPEEIPSDRLPTNITLLTPQDIDRTGFQNIGDVLEHIVSIDIRKTGPLGSFSTIHLRGAAVPGQTKILLDGVPIGGIGFQTVDVSKIPIDSIDRIEVIRGGASVRHGTDAMGGIVRITTKRAASGPAQTKVTLEGRSFGTQIYRGEMGARGETIDGTLTLSRSRTDGFQENQDFDIFSAWGRLGFNFPGEGDLLLDAVRIKSVSGDPQGTPAPIGDWNGQRERSAVNPNARRRDEVLRGRIAYSGRLTEFFQINGAFYIQKRDFDTVPADNFAPNFIAEERIAGGHLHAQGPFGLLFGGDIQRDRRETSSAERQHTRLWAVFIEETWKSGPLTLIPGIRLDQHSRFGNTINPRLTGIFQASGLLKFSANIARAFRIPAFADLVLPTGNPSIRAETAWNYDLGAQISRGATRLTITGFLTKVRDMITINTSLNQSENLARAEISGLELDGQTNLGRYFSAKMNYTFLHAIDQHQAGMPWHHLRLTPRHSANAVLSFRTRTGFELNNEFHYRHKQFEADGDGGLMLPSYSLWDIRLSQRILETELTFAVNNVTNRHYADSLHTGVYDPQPGRNIWGGMTIRFAN